MNTVETKTSNSEVPQIKSTTQEFSFESQSGKFSYSATTQCVVLRKNEEPSAEIFCTSYIKKDSKAPERPITFIFNGGPGAASAYLHVGSIGPFRATFNDDGTLPPPPVKIINNQDSWLSFSDLVFIDPVATGFSRVIKNKNTEEKKEGSKDPTEQLDPKEYFGVNRDIDALCEFIQRFLSDNKRWTSPCYIAGESYGGFRVAKLAKKLQEHAGVGLCGAILISPALELNLLSGSDYDAHMWVDVFPSFVATAWKHKLGHFAKNEVSLEQALKLGEEFALQTLSRLLVSGAFMNETEKAQALKTFSDLSGLPLDYVTHKAGRVVHIDFTRRLLKDARKVCGLYDASITLTDPFPDRDTFQGPEPTLFSIDRVFAAGINALLRETLKVETHREYKLLNMDVNTAWKVDEKKHAFDVIAGATDDLRYGMAMNPHMKVIIVHGYYDLVTPYFATKRIASLLKLTKEQEKQLTLKNYEGGHMFYTWKRSREEFTKDIRNIFES